MLRSIGRTMVVGLLLAACGSGGTGGTSGGPGGSPGSSDASAGASPSAVATPCATATAAADPSSSPGTAGCGSAGGPGGGNGGVGGGTGGGPGATVTHKWNEETREVAPDLSSVITQRQLSSATLTLTKIEDGSWSITGRASISGAYTSDFRSHADSPLGPCDTHYTDDASASGDVDITDGGLEARDGFYQFFINIPGVDGSNATVRDDSGCFGTNNAETTPWSIAPETVGGSGEYTGTTFSGTTTEPRTGGDDTLSWSFTIEP